jgi:hypothetical protein
MASEAAKGGSTKEKPGNFSCLIATETADLPQLTAVGPM